eukprot:gene1491-2872_t
MERSEKFRVVIVGYGIAGTQVTALLSAIITKEHKEKDVEITVLTPIDYNEVSLPMTNVLATGPIEHNKVIFPLLREDHVNYVIGSCAQLNERSIVTSKGITLEFDACVLATGLNYPIFQATGEHSTMESRKKFISGLYSQIISANTIVLSGAGPVGCELAADIKIRYPSKRVVLVSTDILTTTSEPLRNIAKSTLKRQGIELRLNEKILSYKNGKATTSTGQIIDCEVYIPCYAKGPNTDFVPSDMKDEQGYVRVTEFLNSSVNPRVFAIADCSDYDKAKLAVKAEDQRWTVVLNIMSIYEKHNMIPHKKNFIMGTVDRPIIVSLGHDHPKAYGLGPDLPGFIGNILWACCCFGYPCSAPAGYQTSKMKTDLNKSITPKKGFGIMK